MIEIKDPITIQDLDAFLGIAAFVDSKLPPVRPPKAKQMYDLLEVLPSPEDFKYYEKDNFVRIIPTARQLTIYGFILSFLNWKQTSFAIVVLPDPDKPVIHKTVILIRE